MLRRDPDRAKCQELRGGICHQVMLTLAVNATGSHQTITGFRHFSPESCSSPWGSITRGESEKTTSARKYICHVHHTIHTCACSIENPFSSSSGCVPSGISVRISSSVPRHISSKETPMYTRDKTQKFKRLPLESRPHRYRSSS